MAETVFTASQVAKLLGVSGGMVRRYAISYEKITGEVIPQHPRDGRQFNQGHLDTFVAARRFVAGRQGLSVETGLKLALGLADLPAMPDLELSADANGAISAEALKTALSEVVSPLLTELRSVSESNAKLSRDLDALRAELAQPHEQRQLENRQDETEVLPDRDGVLVKIARQLERWLGRKND